MRGTRRLLLWFWLACAPAACDLNPQPPLPNDSNGIPNGGTSQGPVGSGGGLSTSGKGGTGNADTPDTPGTESGGEHGDGTPVPNGGRDPGQGGESQVSGGAPGSGGAPSDTEAGASGSGGDGGMAGVGGEPFEGGAAGQAALSLGGAK